MSTSLLGEEIPEVENEDDGQSETGNEENKSIPIKSRSMGSLTTPSSSYGALVTLPSPSAVQAESTPCTAGAGGADKDSGH